MEKIGFRIKQLLWPSICLVALTLIWFLPWRFQVNDDVIMMWLISGAYTGEAEAYVIFMHPVLSRGLSTLYKIQYFNISWYSLLWFVCIYYAFLLIHFRIQKANFSNHWKIFLNLLSLSIGVHLCIFPQFTLVSGFLALASWVYIIQENRSRSALNFSLFIIGVTLSILIRAEAFLLVTGGVIFFFLALKLEIRNHKKSFLLATLIFLSLAFSKTAYEQNSVFTDFLRFNKLRHQVIDHPVFYEKSAEKEFYKNEEWLYFSNRFFQDSSVDLEQMVTMKELLDQEYFSWKYFSKSIKRYWEVQTAEMFKGFISVLLIALFLFLFWKEKILRYMILWFILFFIANHIFHFRGRVVFLFFIVLLLPVLEGDFKRLPLQLPKILSFLLLIVLMGHFSNFWAESKKREQYLSEYDELIKISDKSKFIMLEGFPIEYFSKKYDQHNPVPFFTHGWVSRSPFQDKTLQRFGFTSLKDVTSFSLIVVKENAPFLTQDYMNSINPGFFLKDSLEKENLVLYQYLKRATN